MADLYDKLERQVGEATLTASEVAEAIFDYEESDKDLDIDFAQYRQDFDNFVDRLHDFFIDTFKPTGEE